MLRRWLNVQLEPVRTPLACSMRGGMRTAFLTGALRSRFNPVVLHSEQLESKK